MSVLERCPSYRTSNKGIKDSRCPFYRGVRLLEVSIKREPTILLLFIYLYIYCFFIKTIYFNFFMFQDVWCSGFIDALIENSSLKRPSVKRILKQ